MAAGLLQAIASTSDSLDCTRILLSEMNVSDLLEMLSGPSPLLLLRHSVSAELAMKTLA